MKLTPLKILTGVLLTGLLAFVIFFFWFRAKNEDSRAGLKPKMGMAISKIDQITDSTVSMSLRLLIDNPLPAGLKIQNFSYLVKLEETEIIKSTYAEKLEVLPEDSTWVNLPVKVRIEKLTSLTEKLAKLSDSARYQFEAIINLEKPVLGQRIVQITVEKYLPLIRLPKVEIVKFDLEKIRLTNSEIVIRLKLSNPNVFDINFKDPQYTFDLGKQTDLVHGQKEGLTKIPAKDASIFEIPAGINLGKTLKTAGHLILKGKKLPFKMHFETKVMSENAVMNKAAMKIDLQGDLKDIQDLRENVKENSP